MLIRGKKLFTQTLNFGLIYFQILPREGLFETGLYGSVEIYGRRVRRDRNSTRGSNISAGARNSRAENLRAGNWRAGNSRCARTRVGGAREGSPKDAVDSRGMEAAPRRHNITILGRPPGARGGRRHGREAGVGPSARSRRGGDRVGFSKPARGVATSGRRASARRAGASAALALCLLPSRSRNLLLSASLSSSKRSPRFFITGVGWHLPLISSMIMARVLMIMICTVIFSAFSLTKKKSPV
ncbi:hypothetical protein PUN28_019082 [Cardiocondyla obscurior]|uniref:Uncharacterized protein n=1 Tax=Cardiocondyla obscurior TaxID=286306 RepID=A0AAW2EH20_9HYME